MSKTNAPAPAPRRPRQPLTEARRRAFLAALRETGVFRWAARAASPNADEDSGAVTSFRDLARRDPRFRAEVADAIEFANARIEAEAVRRAVEGVPEPVFQKGARVTNPDGTPATVTRYSDRLLERLLESRMPERWSPKRQIEHSGSVTHSHGVAVISIGDIDALSGDERRALAGILKRIKAARGEPIDVEFVEVDGDEPAALPAPTREPATVLSEADTAELARITGGDQE